jgi:Rps23 Pro-64 3,4-dihydroxylase Tpa1-like proline 4-hydroxylase
MPLWSAIVQPARNSVVLFPGSLTHEILPVRCPSRNFAHSRFTVNGWLRGPLGKGERDARRRAHYVNPVSWGLKSPLATKPITF